MMLRFLRFLAESLRLLPLRFLRFLAEPLQLFWKSRYMLYQTTRNDIVSRYAGSLFGVVWTVVYPLALLAIYTVVYVYIFPKRFDMPLDDSAEYVGMIFCGLVPFLGFSEAISLATCSVAGSSHLLKNTLFPVDFIPVKATLSGLCTQVVGTVLVIGASIWMGWVSPWTLLVPVIFLAQLAFMLGLGWILGALNVYFRDVQTLVPLVMVMLMVSSPIVYTEDMVPGKLRMFLVVNPIYYIIAPYRDVLVNGIRPRGVVLEVLLAMSTVSFYVGYWFFSRIKKAFADYV